MLAREVMLDSERRSSASGERQDTSPKISSPAAALRVLPDLGLFLGFPAPKDRSHFFVNPLRVHTSHFVNHHIRLFLGLLGLRTSRVRRSLNHASIHTLGGARACLVTEKSRAIHTLLGCIHRKVRPFTLFCLPTHNFWQVIHTYAHSFERLFSAGITCL
jgi:hypothetical protein